MGVQGWGRLLAEKGWIPDYFLDKNGTQLQQHDETSSLWMSQDVIDQCHPLLEGRLVDIPPGSELHVDGFCLCFRIHQIAYARHCRRVLRKNKKKKAKKWTAAQTRHMIPCFLPAGLLTQVTQEFVETLREELQLKLLVYWDGDERYAPPTGRVGDRVAEDPEEESFEEDDNDRDEPPASFKHKTELVRRAQQGEQWSMLQDYCIHGKVPPTSMALAQWQKGFPKNRIFITQVMHTLLQMEIPMRFCDEEADSIMATAVTGKRGAFILGLDSDFCFFPDTAYIPINTLTLPVNVSGGKGSLKAIVMRRHALAESLNIPDSAMVELAILLGNDYVSSTESFELPAVQQNSASDNDMDHDAEYILPTTQKLQHQDISVRLNAFLCLLRHQGEGFQIQSRLPEIQECLCFVRRLYGLQDMSGYEMENPILGHEPFQSTANLGMTVHLSAELKNATIDPIKGDTCLQDAVVRYLEMIVKHEEEVLTRNHILAFQMLSSQRPPFSEIDTQIKDPGWRPSWRDVPAVYWIERIINAILRNVIKEQHVNGNIKYDGIEAPGDVFDSYLYHAYLRVAREAHSLVEEDPDDDTEAPDLVPELSESHTAPRLILPVDQHEEEILNNVKRHRVTIIQGDTGCGKSSRIPVMLLKAPPPDPTQTDTKLFISQPRRIAAKALVERLRVVEPELKDQIALRMGHGVREYESNATRAWFVTTGYLVRLLANHHERFDDISVLIVDEVHERSVDTDILCLLCRRLLATNNRIRLILMSATLAADMYRQYFGVPEPPIRVGARRFAVKEVYLDDLKREVRLSSRDGVKASELYKECMTMKCKRPPSMQYMEKAYSVVANLATVIGKPGSSVLIFVPGMNDIVAITEIIETITIAGIRFTTVPIHSDIPFEDQMLVFDVTKNDEVKIVIATNAAESSLTLPEVDNVICLGLCKQIVYNEASHRQMLTPTWISRASATQRAGRTGRVRPGTVYRIYARQSYERDMEAFEPGEMLRVPLDSVILMLKEMLTDDEQVSEVLLSCLEPPDISTIDRSFESLHKSHFITTPDDSCQLTNLGSFVSSLGIDLALGSLIGLGIQMGVGAQAIQMAAILSFPKTPWVMSNPLVHSTASFNENTSKSFVSRCHFDANLFSEPLSIMNLIWEYERINDNDVSGWCKFHNIFLPRIRRLASTTVNLRKRVADFLGIPHDVLQVTTPPVQMPHGMVSILRVLQVWVFHETLIQFDPSTLQKLQKKMPRNGATLDIHPRSDTIEKGHLKQILTDDRHPFKLIGSLEIRQRGDFEYIQAGSASRGDFTVQLEAHLLSYATEKRVGLVCISFQNILTVYTVRDSTTGSALFDSVNGYREADTQGLLILKSNEEKPGRGIAERPCGLWTVEQPLTKSKNKNVSWMRYGFAFPNQLTTKTSSAKKQTNASSAKKQAKERGAFQNEVKSIADRLQENLGRTGDHKCLFLHFPWQSVDIAPNKRLKFSLALFGTTTPVNSVDMRDILGPRVESSTKQIAGNQKVHFDKCDNKPRVFKKAKDVVVVNGPSSWERPLIKCAPEGVRVISALVSSRRRENILKLMPLEMNGIRKEADGCEEEDADVSVHVDKTTNVTFRWKRFNTTSPVYIDANSVPATAVPVDDPSDLFCVCANTLEVRGGGLRAEGLTLLPQGRAFLLLARFTFGLFQQENVEDGTIIPKALKWIGVSNGATSLEALVDKIEQSVDFHQSAMDLGETLECFPDKVAQLLDILDEVDGYDAKPWDDLSSNPFIRQNMIAHQQKVQHEQIRRFYRRNSSGVDGLKTGIDSSVDVKSRHQIARNHNRDLAPAKLSGSGTSTDPEATPENFLLIVTPLDVEATLNSLFDEAGEKTNLGACRRLAKLVQEFRRTTRDVTTKMSLNSPDWQLYSVEIEESELWYKAVFQPHDIDFTEPRRNTGAWMQNRKDHWRARPRTISGARMCSPPYDREKLAHKKKMMIAPNSKNLVFKSLNLAVQMEAAFWLERQFGLKNVHWYERSESELREALLRNAKQPQSNSQMQPKNKKKNKPKKKKNSNKAS